MRIDITYCESVDMYSILLPKVRLIYHIVFILVTFTFPVTRFTFGCVSFDGCGPCVRVQPASRGRCCRVGWCCGAPTYFLLKEAEVSRRHRRRRCCCCCCSLGSLTAPLWGRRKSDRRIIQLGNVSTRLTAKTAPRRAMKSRRSRWKLVGVYFFTLMCGYKQKRGSRVMSPPPSGTFS